MPSIVQSHIFLNYLVRINRVKAHTQIFHFMVILCYLGVCTVKYNKRLNKLLFSLFESTRYSKHVWNVLYKVFEILLKSILPKSELIILSPRRAA